MPQALNKTGKEYEAIWGKKIFTPNDPIESSSDFSCGALANELEYLRAYTKYVVNAVDVDAVESIFLEKIIKFFINMKRIYDEEDSGLRNRFFSLIRRKANKRWSTKWSFKDVFSYFFNPANIYVIENYTEDGDDLILNGNFEEVTGADFDDWTKQVSGSSVINISTTEMFQDARCPEYSIDASNSEASLSQTINSVAVGDYKLSLFHKDDEVVTDPIVKVRIQRSTDSYYYNFSTNTWQAGDTSKTFPVHGTNYGYSGIYVNNDTQANLTLKISNAGASGQAYKFYIDRIRFGLWKTYPSIKILVVSAGQSGEYMSFWAGEDDNLADRGECEETTSPMIFDETTPVLSNALWARDGTEKYWGDYSYKFTKNIVSGTEATVDLVDNNLTTDLHGLEAEKQYSFIVRIKIPSGGILGSEIKIQIHDYVSSWEIEEQVCALTYDEWQYVKVLKTLRTGATGAILRLKAESDAALNEYFNIDDIRVVEGDVGNLEYASFFDNDFIGGPGGRFPSDIYEKILKKIKEAGSKSNFEIIGRTV